jgi:Raf kinase inhibitor-like YbhB/YbcL family protein
MKTIILQLPILLAAIAGLAQPAAPHAPDWFAGPGLPGGTNNPPPQAAPFLKFAPRVTVTWDDRYLYVQNNGLPDHGMMVGITSWQQQVPLPQPYFGENAWAIPLHPVPAKTPRPIKNDFLRGAVAVAVDGIPIFNPQNNRGEISKQIGELDLWGGHCGRADDYHYHVAPVYLRNAVGRGEPVAYALDGYPIYGPTEPDGSTPASLDAFQGHSTPRLGYHYHASTNYPYVMGGFHGEVVELNGQVDPQPRAQPVRPAQPPLRGAKIVAFTNSPDDKDFSLLYTVDNRPASVNYHRLGAGSWEFQFIDADGKEREAVYATGPRRGDNPPPDFQPRPRSDPADPVTAGTASYAVPCSGHFVLSSPVMTNGGAMPVKFTGDGAGISPPLAWDGAPAGTRAYALSMHTVDRAGATKWYWTLYNIPAAVHSLPENARGIGIAGNNSVNRTLGYAPPHSQGPGVKTYFITVYALSAPVQLSVPPEEANRLVLLAAIKNHILDSAQLEFTSDRTAFIGGRGEDPRPAGPRSRPRQDDPNQ